MCDLLVFCTSTLFVFPSSRPSCSNISLTIKRAANNVYLYLFIIWGIGKGPIHRYEGYKGCWRMRWQKPAPKHTCSPSTHSCASGLDPTTLIGDCRLDSLPHPSNDGSATVKKLERQSTLLCAQNALLSEITPTKPILTHKLGSGQRATSLPTEPVT